MRTSFLLLCVILVVLGVIRVCNGDKHNGGKHKMHFKDDKLRMNFYHKTCPQVERIAKDITWSRVSDNPSLAAKLLRLHYHDCFVRGCDASILLNSTQTSKAEKEARPNLSLSGYDVIDAIKDRLEQLCPGTVSCADIVALAARDAVSFKVTGNLPSASSNFTTLKQNFASKDLNVVDLVTLSGAHSIGISHCVVIFRRLFNFTGKGDTDPSLSPTYAKSLRQQCSNPPNPTVTLEMDPGSSLSFDSHYYRILKENKGLFQSDAALLTNPISALVANTLQNTEVFFAQFARSMVNMGAIGVLTGNAGEIRTKCSIVN